MKVFVAGSRKFLEDIEKFVESCRSAGIETTTAEKTLSGNLSEAEKEALSRAFDRIDSSDAVYVFAKGGYVGATVIAEMAYAFAKGKPIISSEEVTEPAARALVSSITGTNKFFSKFTEINIGRLQN